ncbi:MBL fold metallo-hydrolase [Qingshengfaniella alkalisoli]|uniref:MBL fold metallo-hydrolase n=1 Tax=Qingshengfaniella alkalisoli TaxID=2599296 RepID=A0A5B8I8E1_9RHOB|nr:MBL fold metallo-hydrolase [Qingshengfaniella alkalisoli]QDY70029.1 MBL fold metallo-hydrolase [Qingshengfaniella alkalisoli]
MGGVSDGLRSRLLERRDFLVGSAAIAAISPFVPRVVWGHGPKTHREMIGDVELTVISDGHLTIPSNVLAPQAPRDEFEATMMERFGQVPETVRAETNHAILRVGNDLILVDNGSGKDFQPNAGKLLEHLQINGIDPADVTKLVFTHAHPDHVWGTLGANGGLNFPNADYYVAGAEFDFWMDPDTMTALPADFHPFVIGARRDLTAIEDRMIRVKDGDMIGDGISAISTPGHTPGHISVLVDHGEGLIIGGDVVGNDHVHFAHPEWAFGFDAIPEQGIDTRKRLLDRLATDRHRLLGYHFTYPGTGYVERAGTGYRLVAG